MGAMDPRFTPVLAAVSRGAGSLTALVGGLVLLGWLLDVTALKSVLPGHVTMKANTALGLVLAGCSLALAVSQRRGRWLRPLARLSAALVAAIGGLTLSQYVLGVDLRLDQLLFTEAPGAVGTSHPGRMAPATALSFLVFGGALLALHGRRSRGLAQGLALAGGFISFVAVIGYGYGAGVLYGLGRHTAMALHTAMAFGALAVGLLCAVPEQGLMGLLTSGSVAGMVTRRLLPGTIGVLVGLGWLVLRGGRGGHYDAAYAIALLVVLGVVGLTVVGLATARWLVQVGRAEERAREQLREAQQDLERRVAERTRELAGSNQALKERMAEQRRDRDELAQKQKIVLSLLEDARESQELTQRQHVALEQANQRLRELSVVKDEFVAKVSHDLRTPLTSIKEGLSLVLDNALGPTTADQQEFLRVMDADIDRLTELINNMLDISKIEAGRMRLSRRRMDVRAVLESILRSYRLILGGRSVRSEFADVPAVFIDANRMTQVFTNLLSNAIKFTNETGTITLRVQARDGAVSVGVEDDGPGIAADDLPKLFQKFSQVGAALAGRPRGTGLGLVVCKELTELHGGRIDVASQVGQGTTFTVSLPRYSDDYALDECLRELEHAAGGDPQAGLGVLAIGTDLALEGGLAALEEDVRRHVHRGDAVLAIEPSWIAVVAQADAEGLKAMAGRLAGVLAQGSRLRYGYALAPREGQTGSQLFAKAKAACGPLEALGVAVEGGG